MDSLKGKTLLIGRDGERNRLMVSITTKAIALGNENCVPASVSRCKPLEKMAHCKIDVDSQGNMVLTNLKPGLNKTYVNGTEIATKAIKPNDGIELGDSPRYRLSLEEVLTGAKKIAAAIKPAQPKVNAGPAAAKKEPEKYSIRHLEGIWAKYEKDRLRLQQRQRRLGLICRVPMMFSMFSGVMTGVSQVAHWGPEVSTICLVLTVIGLIVMAYGFYLSSTDKTLEKLNALTARLENEYVCPKPQCRHFLGAKSYNILKQDKKCPYCRSEYLYD